jgi:Methyltransferase domain
MGERMMSFVKSAARRVLPKNLVAVYNDYQQKKLARRNLRLTTEQVFTEIYLNSRWGGRPGTFCSGDGSHETSIVAPYVAAVTAELVRIGAASMTAIDLGCGDYSVGRQLSPFCGQYIGVDIVKSLVAHNQAAFGVHNVSFHHANIIDDAIPDGDVCFVRQVLQHLSNEQIAAVLPKLNKFRRCFITEHHPSPNRLRLANQDKSHGENIRVSSGSGIFLDQPPFNIPAARYDLLLEVPGIATTDDTDSGIIRTYVLKSTTRSDGSSPRSSNRAA